MDLTITDITGIAPRWLNIRRGQFLCYLLGLAIVPWKFLVSASQ
jgi:nucleobase:cation symporter-1, NCS1 family